MGYKRWKLNLHEDYARKVALWRVFELIEAEACLRDGPFALMVESPVTGWDDVVEVGERGGRLYSHHYQIKHQYGDFKKCDEQAIVKLLLSIEAVLKDNEPCYAGYHVAPQDRSFTLILPTLDVSVDTPDGEFGLSALRTLCLASKKGGSDGIRESRGANRPEAEKDWLDRLTYHFGQDLARATKALAHLYVEPLAEVSLNSVLQSSASRLFGNPGDASNALRSEIADLVPEGPLTLATVAEIIQRYDPYDQIRALTIHGPKKCWLSGILHGAPPRLTRHAAILVERVWRRPHGVPLRIGFGPRDPGQPPSKLALAITRLIAHATRREFALDAHLDWYSVIKNVSGVTLGVDRSVDTTLADESCYRQHRRQMRLEPSDAVEADLFADELSQEMTAHFWDAVRLQVSERSALERREPIEQLVSDLQLKAPRLLQQVLRGWWEPNQIKGELRAGPTMVEAFADIVIAVVAVMSAFADAITWSNVDDNPSFFSLGSIPFRALAISRFSVRNEYNECEARDLDDVGCELVAPPGIVLLRTPGLELLREKMRGDLFSPDSGAVRLDQTCQPAALILAKPLARQARNSPDSFRKWIFDEYRRQVGARADADWNAVTQVWKEDDNAQHL